MRSKHFLQFKFHILYINILLAYLIIDLFELPYTSVDILTCLTHFPSAASKNQTPRCSFTGR